MKFIILIIFVLVTLTNAQTSSSCSKLLSPHHLANKCIIVSIAGVNNYSLSQEGYKGYMEAVDGGFKNKGIIVNLQTYETYCYNGKRQPFSVHAAFNYDNVKIFLNGTISIQNTYSNMKCFDYFATFESNFYLYSLTLRALDTCYTLDYGEAC
ncbi:hypothetical protein CYY_007373 [Polysphondylium violaceum]|uniref:Carbohydrate binding domain-containing protein n=1 Tax=Polysphondylium violaceum TaxID=133409 RepID=A0A8J4UQX6_9MYCE|nr:hypothetical protein CYY_007373 [Polysphondylium violaceum]